MPTPRERLDQALVARRFAGSRTQAQALILAGRVRVGGQRADKPGHTVAPDAIIEVEAPPRFVSRGGDKLVAAIEHFKIPFADCSVLDVGASTGGFTDCALQHGAREVTCVDVGRAQLHDRLRRDPRVTNFEQINARLLKPGALPRADYDRVVIDVSFISLRSVLPAVWPFLAPGGFLIALVKPQFEAGREEATRGRGVIRDDIVRERALAEVRAFALAELPAVEDLGAIESPLAGADGNREFLLALRKQAQPPG
jgi:23S rRNA (cytidine1920-2'-O)/16S rRNA (cytidine1409-2'-O)-methyltransferase